MFKRDRIFWVATAIFASAIGLFAATGEQLWLMLMIISYLLRPTLASLGLAKGSVDERQMTIQHRSGNIAFAVMMAASVVMAVRLAAAGDENWEMFNIVIVVGLATKALFNVLLVKNYRTAAIRIIVSVGLLITLFATMSHGVTFESLLEALPGVCVIGLGLLALRFPRAVGIAVACLTVAAIVAVLQKGLNPGQLTTALLIGAPLFTAAGCLILGDRDANEVTEVAGLPST